MGKTKMVKYDGTVAGAVSDAFNIIEELAGEMRDAFDNTPESLQGSGVGEMRGEAADALEEISEPVIPDFLGTITMTMEYKPLKARASRADRIGEAIMLADFARQILEDMELKGDPEDERQQAVDDIQAMIDEAEAVTFPGMYG